MTQTRKFVSSSMAVLLMTSAGCAGNGLKSMFTRNETAGYKTLEEVEAEREKKEAALADGSGPRFAPWLPFGKKATDDSEALAASDNPSSADDTPSGSKWKNPFRRQETVEADPFLTKETPEEAVVADRKKPAGTKAELASDEKDLPNGGGLASGKDKSVKTASVTKEAKPTVDDEDQLVDKFEKHFERNAKKPELTEEFADETARPVVARQTEKDAAPKKSLRHDLTSDDQLLEFEKLLAEKKAAATPKSGYKNPFADEPVAEASEMDFESIASRKPESAGLEQQDSNSVESFDSLLAEAGISTKKNIGSTEGRLSSRKPAAATVAKTQVEVADVEVADQAGLFGPLPGKKERSEFNLAGTASDSRSSRSKISEELQWTEPKKTARIQPKAKTPRAEDSRADQFAAMFVAAEAAPAASLPDTPDTGVWASASTFGEKSEPAGRSRKNPAVQGAVQIVSSGRTLPAETFGSTAAPQEALYPTPSVVDPPSEFRMDDQLAGSHLKASEVASSATGARFSFSLRSVVMLLGGIIVAVLLFAPARKKPISGHELPVHG